MRPPSYRWSACQRVAALRQMPPAPCRCHCQTIKAAESFSWADLQTAIMFLKRHPSEWLRAMKATLCLCQAIYRHKSEDNSKHRWIGPDWMQVFWRTSKGQPDWPECWWQMFSWHPRVWRLSTLAVPCVGDLNDEMEFLRSTRMCFRCQSWRFCFTKVHMIGSNVLSTPMLHAKVQACVTP